MTNHCLYRKFLDIKLTVTWLQEYNLHERADYRSCTYPCVSSASNRYLLTKWLNKWLSSARLGSVLFYFHCCYYSHSFLSSGLLYDLPRLSQSLYIFIYIFLPDMPFLLILLTHYIHSYNFKYFLCIIDFQIFNLRPDTPLSSRFSAILLTWYLHLHIS